jgi:hypothetical protein
VCLLCKRYQPPKRSGRLRKDMVKNRLWRIWAKALGQKEGRTDQEADRIAFIRSMIVLFYIVTNLFIIAGVVRHW